MLFRKVAIRSASSFLGSALARLLTAGSRSRVSLRHLVLHGFLWALVFSLPRLALAQNVTTGTVVYGTGQSGTNWAGGSIAAGATLRLDPGATVSGGLGGGGGTFQFNSTGAITIATSLATSDAVDNGLFSVTNTGTATATSAAGYPEANVFFRTVSVSAGQLRFVWATDGTTPTNYQITANNPLTITGGSVVNGDGMVSSPLYGDAIATVSGGTWTNGNNLFVGGQVDLVAGNGPGNGTLNVSGGSVTNVDGNIGYVVGSTGTANISGGTWASSGSLTVGNGGTGTLNVNGGIVTNINGIIGDFDGVGIATVSSGTWASSGALVVGMSGTGTLNVTGGSVTNTSGYISNANNSVGSVTVSGGTWATSGDLKVGNYYNDPEFPEDFAIATGTITMTGGLVTVSGILSRAISSGTSLGTINLNAGGTLQIGTGGAGSGISVGNLTNNGTLAFNQSNNYTYSDAISGSGAVTKAGAGRLSLSGANSFTGGVTISEGTLVMGSSTALGNGGSLAVNGGTLDLSGRALTVNALSGSSAGTIQSGVAGAVTLTATAATNSTFAGSIRNGSGTVALTKSGTGTLTLTGANSYSGDTTISGGTLQIGAGGSVGTLVGNVVNNAVLAFNRSNAVNFTGVISGTGGLTKSGASTLTLSAASSYTGGTTINSGTLQIGNGGTVGSITGNVVNNATLAFNRSNSQTFAGVISGTGGLTKSGGGALTLTGSSTYTGVTNINGGTLVLGSGSSYAVLGSGTITFGGGTLRPNDDANRAIDYSSRIKNSSGAISLLLSSGTLTFASTLDSSNTGGLTRSGGGTLTLSASNGYTGVTYVNGGVLALGNTNALAGSGTLTFDRPDPLTTGVLQYSGSNTVDYSAKIQNSSSVIAIDTNGQNVTFASGLAVSNTGGLAKMGAGTLTLSASNAYRGVTTISGGTLALGDANALAGSGTLSFAGGTLQYSASNTVDYSSKIQNSGSAITIDTNGQNVTFASGLPVSNTGGLSKSGLGTLTLSASNAYTGSTTISEGTLQIGAGGTTGSINGNVVNNAALAFNRSNALSFSGTISGSGAVTKLGAGMLTLARPNTYSGLTTISGGTLALSGSGAIGTGGLNLGTTGSPGVLDIAGLTASTYSLPSSANLAGVGTISGSGKTLAVLGSLAPGNSAGTITVGTGLSLDLSASGSSVFEITSPAFTAGTFDLVSGDGSVVFGGILNLAFSGGSYADGTDVLQIFANTGGRSGNFSAVNFTGLGAAQSATFNPTTGYITVVPEPSTCASLLASAGLAAMMRWRKQRAAA